MSVKVCYSISGFDCPNCAAKSEKHLNKQKEIDKATLDFTNERLYVTYKDKELSVDQVKERIAQVESDPIELSLLSEKKVTNHSIFDKEFFFMLTRIVVSILIAVFTKIFVNYHDNFTLAIILYGVATLICLYDITWKVIKNIIHKINPIDMNLLLTISALGVITLR